MQDAEVTKSLGEAPPEKRTFSRLQVFGRVGKYVISVCIKTQKGWQMHFMAVKKSKRHSDFVIYSYLKNSAFTAV